MRVILEPVVSQKRCNQVPGAAWLIARDPTRRKTMAVRVAADKEKRELLDLMLDEDAKLENEMVKAILEDAKSPSSNWISFSRE